MRLREILPPLTAFRYGRHVRLEPCGGRECSRYSLPLSGVHHSLSHGSDAVSRPSVRSRVNLSVDEEVVPDDRLGGDGASAEQVLDDVRQSFQEHDTGATRSRGPRRVLCTCLEQGIGRLVKR